MADKEALLREREERRQVQEQFLAVYDEVKAELMRIPGVVEVGFGLREKEGKLTAEPVFRVYVQQKLPEAEVPASQVIPKEIRGFPTDVITERKRIPILGFNDENDKKNYKTKPAGCSIGPDEAGSGTGTLGCFATLTSDNSTVILSCHHVLMQDEFFHGKPRGTDDNKGVGQPDFSGSCCCVCNEIAKTVTGDKNLDCAIARLNSDVKFAPKVKTIKKADGTVELDGFIEGSDAAVQNDEVWKVGYRTGLTRGTLSQVTPKIEIHPTAAFPYFADHGDSGSVVVNATTNKVVGLLNSIDKEIKDGGTLGFGMPIGPILSLMKITVMPTDHSQSYDVLDWEEERIGVTGPPTPAEVFAATADRLEMTERGQELISLVRRHRAEIADLVNHRRPVTVAWHRSQGPAYLAAMMRTAREPAYRLPEELNGVGREEVITRMRDVLLQHGSGSLKEAIHLHSETLIRLWLECSTFDELVNAWECDSRMAEKELR